MDIAAANHKVGQSAPQRREHGGQNRFVVLQVGIHNGDESCRRTQHAFDAGACETPTANAPDAANSCVFLSQCPDNFPGLVRTVVVHESQLPGHACKRRIEAAGQLPNICALVEGRNDNCQERRRGGGPEGAL